MIVDMPPGTGDAQLSLVQTIRLDGVVMVTTPQDVSTGDVLRAIRMFERVNTRVLGIVENMSGFICPCCGERYEIFGRAGGQRLAVQTGVELLGDVPLEMPVREGGDAGVPIVVSQPHAPSAMALTRIAERVAKLVEQAAPVAAGA
jgi:ATP-binding protein involved in chromosome partitioning